MYFKKGVKGNPCKEIWYALGAAEVLYNLHSRRLTVTSLNDGKHGKRSLHFRNMAVDIRTKNLNGSIKGGIFRTLRRRLDPKGFDTLFEYEGTPNEHFHIEYDPKRNEKLIRMAK